MENNNERIDLGEFNVWALNLLWFNTNGEIKSPH
jgi:hypothetical protein